jgi:hypothetical protein
MENYGKNFTLFGGQAMDAHTQVTVQRRKRKNGTPARFLPALFLLPFS